jgi:SAM-dependent methyltransferase
MPEDISTTSAPWKSIANLWNTYFTQPSRVSEKESQQYKKWLKEIKKGDMRVLLLGVTPEIRESLAELKYNVTCIDINPEMIQAMESVLKVKNPHEVVINEDWLNNSLKDGIFDVVVGDCVLENVGWEDRDKLLSEVKRVLKPKGIFLTRVFTMPKKKPYKTLDELLEKFSKKEPNYKSAIELVFDLQIFCYNPKDHKGTFSEPKKVLEKIRGKDGFNLENKNLNKILDMVWDFWCGKYLNKVYYYPLRAEEEVRIKKFFDIVKTFEADDQPYGKITPIYFLRFPS